MQGIGKGIENGIGKVAAFAIYLCLSGAALAQTFPSKPLRLIVPYPAGGPADMFARELSQGMASRLGQLVLVENKGGVGGTLGVDFAAKATPDGYTLALNSGSSVAMAPFARSSLAYDPRKDLAWLTTVVKVPEVLVLHPSMPANTLGEFIAYLKVNPGKFSHGSAGSGGITHLAAELLKAEARVDIVHIPYKGAAPAMTDLLGGQIQMVVLDVPVVLPHIRSGKVKAIAVTSGKRVASLPDVPTTGEGGYPKVISDNWYGLVGAAAIPPAVQARIRSAAVATLESAAVQEQFAKVSAIAIPSTEEEYRAFVLSEQAKWGPIIKAIGFKED